MAELYWIHLPEHKDMFSEGYIGITKHTAKQRFRGHYKAAHHKQRNTNCPIYNAIRKYGDSLIVETVVISDIDYVLDLEEKIRPDVKIGWNVKSGGAIGNYVGTKHSESSIAKMKLDRKALWDTPEFYRKRKVQIVSKSKPDYGYLNSDGSPKRFWPKKTAPSINLSLWENIPHLWNEYVKDPYLIMPEVPKLLPQYPENSQQWIRKILQYFRSGWNPMLDKRYLEDFPIGT